MGLLCLLLLPAVAWSQGLSFGPKLEAKPYLSVDAAPQGATIQLAIVLDVKKPFHINANIVKANYLIPTKLEVTAPTGLTAGKVVYPPFHTGTFFGDQVLNVFEGKTTIKTPLKVAASAKPGTVTLKAVVHYQACDDKNCFPPKDVEATIPVKIVAAGQRSKAINPEIFGTVKSASPGARSDGAAPVAGGQFDIAKSVSRHGWPLTLLLIFLAGMALNLTPCVYPLIPVTIGFFGNQSQGAGNRRQRTLMLAIFYVLGMAVTYSTLGVVAALAGKSFGFVFQHPAVPAVIALIIVALALSMFGLYEIQPPSFIANNARARTGLFGAMFMGLIVGFVAAPCIGPAVVALITFVASTRNPAIGFGLFFTLAMGLGLPYLFLGAFTGAASALPKSGAWTEMVKRVFGLLMLGVALYLVKSLMPRPVFNILFPTYIFAAGGYLFFGERELATKPGIVRFKRISGVAAAGLAAWMLVGAFVKSGEAEIVQWSPYSDTALTAATSSGKPVMIDFYADWCAACVELDEKTFSDARVAAALQNFKLFKADNTKASPALQAVMERFEIKGLPTVVFLGADGQEVRPARLQEFEAPEKFLKRLESAKGPGGSPVAQLPQ
jgi:thioredoxin:protein disulfide reductase